MGKHARLLRTILSGQADAGIDFSALRQLLKRLGFAERIKGSHHIYTREDATEILNLQPRGRKAKPYQVRQVRNIFLKYGIGEADVG